MVRIAASISSAIVDFRAILVIANVFQFIMLVSRSNSLLGVRACFYVSYTFPRENPYD